MRALLDVSVLIALLDRQHASHRTALAWVAQNLSAGWASCPLTENGCIRVLANPRYPTPVGFEVAVEKLTAARARDYHEFWPDDLSIADASLFNATAIQGHQQITDAYLLALAVHRGGRFVTFDKRVSAIPVTGAEARHIVVL